MAPKPDTSIEPKRDLVDNFMNKTISNHKLLSKEMMMKNLSNVTLSNISSHNFVLETPRGIKTTL